MLHSSLPRLGLLFGVLCALTPGLAAAQAESSEEAVEAPPPAEPPAPSTSPSWYSDPFGGMLFGFAAPAGVGLGLVFSGLDENEVYAGSTYENVYALTVDGAAAEKTASLVAYPI